MCVCVTVHSGQNWTRDGETGATAVCAFIGILIPFSTSSISARSNQIIVPNNRAMKFTASGLALTVVSTIW